MTYFLLLLIGLYIALITVVLQRSPRKLASLILAAYLLLVTIATAGYLVLGTTTDLSTARTAAILIVISSGWVAFALLPLTLIALYFEAWFQLYRGRVLALTITTNVALSAGLLVALAQHDDMLVRHIGPGYTMHWGFEALARSDLLAAGLSLSTMLPVLIILRFALAHKRLSFWGNAVPITGAALSSSLALILAARASDSARALLAGLGYALPVLLASLVVIQSRRKTVIDTALNTLLHSLTDGALVLNANHQVVWKNAQLARWTGLREVSGITSVHVLELVRGTPLAKPLRRMLVEGTTDEEHELEIDGEEYVIRLELHPFEQEGLPGAQLLTVRDITASRIRRDLNERRRELIALSAISADISASLELDQVIARALEQVLSITDLSDALVYLHDDHAPRTLTLGGSLTSLDQSAFAPSTLTVDETTAGEVIRTRQTVISTDVGAGTYSAHLRKFGYQSGITVPLLAGGRAIGVLQLASASEHEFGPLEVALLESVGRQIAVAIDNARLHSQERRQRQVAEALREVASNLSSMQLDSALEAMLERLRDIIDYDRATVLLLAEPGRLSVRAQNGFVLKPDDTPIADLRIEIARFPHLLQIFSQRTAQLVADTDADSTWIQTGHAAGSWIGVPLVMHEQVLGCLSITHSERGRFTEADLQIARGFTNQVVIAVENARLFESEQRRRLQAEMLQRASYALVTSSDLDSALTMALHTLEEMLDFDQAHIGLLNAERTAWMPRAFYPVTTQPTPETSVSLALHPLDQRIMETKRAIMVSETRQNRWWRPSQFSYQEVRAWIGAPLLVRDKIIGLLHIESYTPHKFTMDEFQLAQMFANQIAAAIENFHLLEEAGRQNRALRALNTILAASNDVLTQDNLVATALERVLETLNLGGGAIHQRDMAAQELRLLAASGLPDEAIAHLTGMPLASELPPIRLGDGRHYTFTSVPLVSHGMEIGLLSVCQPETPFSAELEQLLVNIGQQLGVVMDNAALFDDTLRREALSTGLGRLGLAISAQLDSDTVLDLICHESIGVFNAQGVYIWLLEGEHLVGAAAYGAGADEFNEHRFSLDDGSLPAQVIHEWRPRFVNRVSQTTALPPAFLALTRAQAVIAVPLVKADIPIGALLLVNTEDPDAFADWLTEQARLLGVQVALTLQNAALFDEIRRHLDQLRLVNEVGRYATAILSLPNLIEGVARKLFDILHYDVIGLLQVEDNQLYIHSIFAGRADIYVDGTPGNYYLSEDGVAWRAMQQAEPVLHNRNCEGITSGNSVEGGAACCSLGIPLLVADEVIGVLVVERLGHYSITPEDLNVLEPLAAQLAISVSNARLFERVRQQTLELEARVVQRTAEIREQQERTEAILSSVADAVIVFDLSGHIVMTNPAAKELFEQHDTNMELSLRIRTLIDRVLFSNDDMNDATEIIEWGPVALQAKAARVLNDDEMLGSVVILRDITQLQELDRMKDNFVSNVSHELRTPLANLKLYLSLLQQGRPERRATYLEVMEREVERLERLIYELLDLSRLQSEMHAERPQVREAVELEGLIRTVVQDNLAWAESEGTMLVYEGAEATLPMVLGDRDQLVRALTNLVSNAIRYTPDGGRIMVRSSITHTAQGDPEWVIIETSDTGIGIPADELPNIFERFYRGSNVNPNIPGTGLGLAIIKEIVGLHGGSIEVESELGQGSTFRLKLPAYNTQKETLIRRDGNE